MFPSNSPRRQSVTYPSYQQTPGGGYDYTGAGSAAGLGPGMYDSGQWPGYHHIYGRYDTEWHNHAAAAAVAAQFQPPSPGVTTPAAHDTDPVYGQYTKPSSLCPPVGDFKPPIIGEFRSSDDTGGGDTDPLRPGPGVHHGRAHHSPDSGLAASDGVSGSDSPSHVHHPQPPSPHDIGLPARPQPARSPYEWMKRPNITARPCKEGSDGKH